MSEISITSHGTEHIHRFGTADEDLKSDSKASLSVECADSALDEHKRVNNYFPDGCKTNELVHESRTAKLPKMDNISREKITPKSISGKYKKRRKKKKKPTIPEINSLENCNEPYNPAGYEKCDSNVERFRKMEAKHTDACEILRVTENDTNDCSENSQRKILYDSENCDSANNDERLMNSVASRKFVSILRDNIFENEGSRQCESTNAVPVAKSLGNLVGSDLSCPDILLLSARCEEYFSVSNVGLSNDIENRIGHLYSKVCCADAWMKLDSVFQSFREHIVRHTPLKLPPTGMINPRNGNLCYVNVVTQLLLRIPQLVYLLMTTNDSAPNEVYRVWRSLYFLYNDYHVKQCASSDSLHYMGHAVNTWRSVGGSIIGGTPQQDASEFLHYILSQLHDECKWNVRKQAKSTYRCDDGFMEIGENGKAVSVRYEGHAEFSPVKAIFGGKLLNLVRNANNGILLSSVEEPFYFLNVPIEKHHKSIQDVIQSYTTVTSCNPKKCIQTVLSEFPMVLVVILKRFYFCKENLKIMKINKIVSFEEKLQIPPEWTTRSGSNSSICKNDTLNPGYHNSVNPVYHLISVVHHKGHSAHGGHYTVSVVDNGKWYSCNDTRISEIAFSEVQKIQGSYILVYADKHARRNLVN